MAATLTVSQIRNELFLKQPGGASGPGRSSTAALGTLFHQVLAGVLTDQAPCSLQVVLRDLEPDKDEWKCVLKTNVYDQLVGPLLTQQYAAMDGQGRQVLDLWVAVQEACDYLVELWWTITGAGQKSEEQGQWFDPERQISREFHRPGWSSPVAVVGQLDAVLRIPDSAHSCLLEWKLGQTSPELDLAQACLYQMLLEGELGPQHQLALAVIGFHPERHDRMFHGPQLETARDKLLNLIGDLAGVTGKAAPKAPPEREKQPSLPKAENGVQPGTVPPKPVPTPNSILAEWTAQTAEKLIKALRINSAPCRMTRDPVVGPAFARFFVFPERGITSRKVEVQADNLQLHLGLASPPGIQVHDGTIAIDLPRPDRVSVPFSQVIPQLPQRDPLLGNFQIPIGVDLTGQWQWCDLVDPSSAHLLVVGTPGSGKSQWLRAALASLLMMNTPETLELVLIDPKQNAFTFAKDFPHLSMPIVVPGYEGIEVAEILSKLVDRMNERNRKMAETNSQTLHDYALAENTPQRRVVIICDEYADLLSGCSTTAEKKELERQIRRLAQIGRAPGFHLILATQQARADILNTSIRCLIAAKVALRVTSAPESRIALEESGAECLLGQGDLYYKSIGAKQRFQGPWLPTEEEELVRLEEVDVV